MTTMPSGPEPTADDALARAHRTEPRRTTVLVRYFASARAAVGLDEERLWLPGGGTVGDAIASLRTRHPDSLARILEAASFLVDGVAARDTELALHDGAELDILPPFAGG